MDDHFTELEERLCDNLLNILTELDKKSDQKAVVIKYGTNLNK